MYNPSFLVQFITIQILVKTQFMVHTLGFMFLSNAGLMKTILPIRLVSLDLRFFTILMTLLHVKVSHNILHRYCRE